MSAELLTALGFRRTAASPSRADGARSGRVGMGRRQHGYQRFNELLGVVVSSVGSAAASNSAISMPTIWFWLSRRDTAARSSRVSPLATQ